MPRLTTQTSSTDCQRSLHRRIRKLDSALRVDNKNADLCIVSQCIPQHTRVTGLER